MNKTLKRVGVASAALTLSFGLAACGEADDAIDSATDAVESGKDAAEDAMEDGKDMADDAMEDGKDMVDDMMTGDAEKDQKMAEKMVFGEVCSAVPTDPSDEGSLGGMADDPVATAASNNPLLGTLATAVTEADLVDTLNSAEELTVFAPTDDAFAKIGEAELDAILADKKKLTKILQHHVLAGKVAPEDLKGKQKTLAGTKLKIKGNVDKGFKIDDEMAAILCGNIPTSNATVYVVDTVLVP